MLLTVFTSTPFFRDNVAKVYLSSWKRMRGSPARFNVIDIDCGCVNRCSEHHRPACLKLDDIAEFYVGNSVKQTTARLQEKLPILSKTVQRLLSLALQKKITASLCSWH